MTRSAAGVLAVEGIDLATVDPDLIATGEGTYHRRHISTTAASVGNSTLRLTYFTARKTETITTVLTTTGTAGTTSGATLARIGIYSVDGSGNLTLVASTANDTTLWVASNTAYTRSLSASWSKVKGTRYALALLAVGGSTGLTFVGTAGGSAINAIAPRLSGLVASQTDLPSTIAVGSVTDASFTHFALFTP